MCKKSFSRFTICNRCIHNRGDRCEAFVNDFMTIVSEDECEDYDDGLLKPYTEDYDEE